MSGGYSSRLLVGDTISEDYAGLPSDDYVPAPRPVVVGELVAIADERLGMLFYSGPFVVISVTQIGLQPDSIAEHLKGERIRFSYQWLGGNPLFSAGMWEGYGVRSWLFADDMRVRWWPELYLQIWAMKTSRSSPGPLLSAPPCKTCGEWPCHRWDDCPDYDRISKGQVHYLRDQQPSRFETFEEAALTCRCGDSPPLVVEPEPIVSRSLPRSKKKTKSSSSVPVIDW